MRGRRVGRAAGKGLRARPREPGRKTCRSHGLRRSSISMGTLYLRRWDARAGIRGEVELLVPQAASCWHGCVGSVSGGGRMRFPACALEMGQPHLNQEVHGSADGPVQ